MDIDLDLYISPNPTPALIVHCSDPVVTQSLAKAARDREDIRSELFQALEAVKQQNSEPERRLRMGRSGPCLGFSRLLFLPDVPFDLNLVSLVHNTLHSIPMPHSITIRLSDPHHPTESCEKCPTSWIHFQGSCYYFSETQAIWNTAQSFCSVHGAHLVIVKDLDEQVCCWDLAEENQSSPELVGPGMSSRLGQMTSLLPSRVSCVSTRGAEATGWV